MVLPSGEFLIACTLVYKVYQNLLNVLRPLTVQSSVLPIPFERILLKGVMSRLYLVSFFLRYCCLILVTVQKDVSKHAKNSLSNVSHLPTVNQRIER